MFLSSSPTPSATVSPRVGDPIKMHHQLNISGMELDDLLWWAVKSLFTYAVIRDLGLFLFPLIGKYIHDWIVKTLGHKEQLEMAEAIAASAIDALDEAIEKSKNKPTAPVDTIDLTSETTPLNPAFDALQKDLTESASQLFENAILGAV